MRGFSALRSAIAPSESRSMSQVNARGGTRTRTGLPPRDFKFACTTEPRDTKSITARQGNELARRAVHIDTR